MIAFNEHENYLVVTTDSREVLSQLEKSSQVIDINITDTDEEFHVQALVQVL